ncbi:MAG: hypothetical protein KDI36_15090 [Pseudomonadales bacterium]|nr:hypothetical protein [Pseudomonadales bacterium]
MAVIWDKTIDKVRYEVRTAGASVRLYTNGAFHSQYNPTTLFSGGVWDLLTLPTLICNNPPARLLLLGVGGGTALHQCRYLFPATTLTGVELNPVHLQLARRFFSCQAPDFDLTEADAVAWIRQQRQTWQVIIDDLFLHNEADAEADPVRSTGQRTAWIRSLRRRLTSDGLLVQNYLSAEEARSLADNALCRETFASCVLFETPTYANCIAALYRQPQDYKESLQRLNQRIALVPGKMRRKLRFACQPLW